MLYDWTSTAALGVVRDIQPKGPLTLTGEGLWVCLISSGRCTASLTDASPSLAGSALILPPQSAAAGHLVLSRAPLTLTPEGESHLLCIQLTGQGGGAGRWGNTPWGGSNDGAIFLPHITQWLP